MPVMDGEDASALATEAQRSMMQSVRLHRLLRATRDGVIGGVREFGQAREVMKAVFGDEKRYGLSGTFADLQRQQAEDVREMRGSGSGGGGGGGGVGVGIGRGSVVRRQRAGASASVAAVRSVGDPVRRGPASAVSSAPRLAPSTYTPT